jgi:hypothetical protein
LNVPSSLRKPGASRLLQSLGRPVPVSIWMPKPVGSNTADKPEPCGPLPHVWYGFSELMYERIFELETERLSIA